MPNAIEDVIEEGTDMLHKATDPRNKKTRSFFASAVILLLFGNAGLQSVDLAGFFGSGAVTTKDMAAVLDNTAILASALSTHVAKAEKVMEEQATTNNEVVQTLVDLMDTINYIDIKNGINNAITQLENKIDSAEARKDEIILEKTRSEINGVVNPELDSVYRSQTRFLNDQIKIWSGEVEAKKRQLVRGDSL